MESLTFRQADRGWRQRAILIIPLLAIVAGLLALLPQDASAHAFLERSEPSENRVLPEAPLEVSLLFTEPVEPDFSRAELYDSTGALVPTEPSRIGEANQILLALPVD